MPITVNMSGVSSGFDPLDIGSYPIRVDDATEEVGKTSGQPYIKLVLEVTEDPNIGRKLFLNLSLQPNALWKLHQTLEAFGWSKEDMDTEEFELDEQDLLDCEAIAVVTQYEYNNTVRSRVERLLPLRESEALGDGIDIDF